MENHGIIVMLSFSIVILYLLKTVGLAFILFEELPLATERREKILNLSILWSNELF